MDAPVFGSSEYWKAIVDVAESKGPLGDRIYVGLRVRVTKGRKHKGRMGKVIRHMKSRYGNPTRYLSGASLDLHLLMGRHGYVALIAPDDLDQPGGVPGEFWVNADYLEVI